MVKYLVELVGFSRADFSLFPLAASAALLRNNLRGSQNLLTVRSKTSGEPFPEGKTRFGKAPHTKKSGAVGGLFGAAAAGSFHGYQSESLVPCGLLGGRPQRGGMKTTASVDLRLPPEGGWTSPGESGGARGLCNEAI